jgi:hypothetical protein
MPLHGVTRFALDQHLEHLRDKMAALKPENLGKGSPPVAWLCSDEAERRRTRKSEEEASGGPGEVSGVWGRVFVISTAAS